MAAFVCFFAIALLFSLFAGAHGSVGVNYGTVGDNLPPAAEVASFLKGVSKGPISIRKMKLFDADPSILSAFANTGIEIVVGMSSADLAEIGEDASLSAASRWINDNVASYVPATKIVGIAAGNEVVGTHNKALVANIVPAMKNLQQALASLNLSKSIFISSPFTLGILRSSAPPSSATFKKPSLMASILSFLASNGFPFMANVYPFFAYTVDPSPFMLDYALFNSTVGYTDPLTNLYYSNMFDAQLDAVYSAMAHLGFSNVSIMVTETGWPSFGDPEQSGVSVLNAQTYINNLINHVSSNEGTPLRPRKPVETYIFALFDENLKPGPTSERHYGLLKPDFSPVYTTSLFDSASSLNQSSPSDSSLSSQTSPAPSPSLVGKSPSPPSASASSAAAGRSLSWRLPLAVLVFAQNTVRLRKPAWAR